MDRPPQQHRLQADPFAAPDGDLALADMDQWGFAFEQSPEETASPNSTHDIRELYLRRNGDTSPADVSSRWLTLASRVWARVQSGFQFDRRVVAGLGLVGVGCALLIGLPRFDFAPSIRTVSGTTYNTAVGRLSSAAGAARDLVGNRPVAPVTTEAAATISRKKVPTATTGQRAPIVFSPALQPVPLVRDERVPAFRDERVPVFRDERDPAFRDERVPANGRALADPLDESDVETPIVYSSDDADVRPPVALRSPGIATVRSNGDKYVSLIEIQVSETGQVESARGRHRPGSLGAALQSNTALSVVKTWRFRPARKNGQPVKYRTTVPFIETFNPAGTTEASR